MDGTAECLARLVLAVCAEMSAGGESAPGLDLLPLILPDGGAEWRLCVGPPRRDRPETLVAAAPATPPDAALAAALAERLARLAGEARFDAFPAFGMRDDRDAPAAAMLLPPEEMEPAALAGHLKRLLAALAKPPEPAAAAEPIRVGEADEERFRKGWIRT